MPFKLNASAAEFVPGSFTESWVSNADDGSEVGAGLAGHTGQVEQRWKGGLRGRS
jgi:hypothetical protein